MNHKTDNTPINNTNPLALNIHLEEYKVIFNHIIERAKIRHTLINYTIVLLAAAFTLGAKIYIDSSMSLHVLFLFVPIPFFLITGLLLENDFIIAGAVAYYHHGLRNKISKVSNVPIDEVMNLEEFQYEIRNTLLYKLLASSRILLVLVIPTFSSLIAYWSKYNWCYNFIFPDILSLIYIIAIIIVFILLIRGVLPNPPQIPMSIARAIKKGKLKF